MSSATDDLKDLFGSFTNLAQSAMQLHTVRVEAEANRRALEIGTARYNFLSRFNLPRDHPDFLSDDEGDWRGPLEELNRQTGEYLDSVKDPAVQRGVKSQLEGRNQQFMLELGGTLATAGRKHAQEDSRVSIMTAIDMGDYGLARSLFERSDELQLLGPADRERQYQELIVPLNVNDHVKKAMQASGVDAGGNPMYPTFYEAKLSVMNAGIKSENEMNMAYQKIEKAHAEYNVGVAKELSAIKERNKDRPFNYDEYLKSFMANMDNMSNENREAYVNYANEEMVNEKIADIKTWTSDQLVMHGRGISYAAASKLKDTLKARLQKQYNEEDPRKWEKRARDSYEDSVNDIDQWKRAGATAGDQFMDSLMVGWLSFRDYGIDTNMGEGVQENGYLARLHWLYDKAIKHWDKDHVVKWVTDTIDDQRRLFKEESLDPVKNGKEEMSLIYRIMAKETFRNNTKDAAFNLFRKAMGNIDDPAKQSQAEQRMTAIWFDAVKITNIQMKSDAKLDREQAIEDNLVALLSHEKYSLSEATLGVFSSSIERFGQGWRSIEDSKIDLFKTSAYGDAMISILKGAKVDVIDKLRDEGKIGRDGSFISSASRPSDIYWYDESNGKLWSINGVGADGMVMQQAIGKDPFMPNTDPARYSGSWGTKPFDTMFDLSDIRKGRFDAIEPAPVIMRIPLPYDKRIKGASSREWSAGTLSYEEKARLYKEAGIENPNDKGGR